MGLVWETGPVETGRARKSDQTSEVFGIDLDGFAPSQGLMCAPVSTFRRVL